MIERMEVLADRARPPTFLLLPLEALPHQYSSLPWLVGFSHLSAAALGTHSHIVEDQVNRKIPYQPFVQYGGVF